jgi:hypothetical protein
VADFAGQNPRTCTRPPVRVFPLLVKRQSVVWPEFEQRPVQSVEPSKAASLIRTPDLKKLVATFVKRVAAAANKSIP